MSYLIGDEQFGAPDKPGYYLVLFAKRFLRKQKEEFVYWDGQRMSYGFASRSEVLQAYPKGTKIPRARVNRTPRVHWREVLPVDNLSAVLKALGAP